MIKIFSSSSSCFSSSRYLKNMTFLQKKKTFKNLEYHSVLRQRGHTCKLINNCVFDITSTFTSTFVRPRKKMRIASAGSTGCLICVGGFFDGNNLISLFYAPNTFFDYLVGGFLSLQVIYSLFFIIEQETDFLYKQFYLFTLFLFAYLNKFQYLLGLALANCLYNFVVGAPLGKKWLINSDFSFFSLVGLFSNQSYDWILNKVNTVEEGKKEVILYLLKGLKENFIEKSRFLFGFCVAIINFVGVLPNPTLINFIHSLQHLNFNKAFIIFKTIQTKEILFLFLSILAYKFYFLWLQNVPKLLVSKSFS